MNVETEDPAKAYPAEVPDLLALERRIAWLRPVVLLAAIISSFWLVYAALVHRGLFVAVLAFVGLSIVYMFGPAPMFAVAASVLFFYLGVVGIWLSLSSYALAIFSLIVDVRRDRLLRRLQLPSSNQ